MKKKLRKKIPPPINRLVKPEKQAEQVQHCTVSVNNISVKCDLPSESRKNQNL